MKGIRIVRSNGVGYPVPPGAGFEVLNGQHDSGGIRDTRNKISFDGSQQMLIRRMHAKGPRRDRRDLHAAYLGQMRGKIRAEGDAEGASPELELSLIDDQLRLRLLGEDFNLLLNDIGAFPPNDYVQNSHSETTHQKRGRPGKSNDREHF